MQDTSRGCVKVSTLHNSICRHCRRGSTYKSMLWSSNTALMPFPGRSVAEWVTVAKCVGVCGVVPCGQYCACLWPLCGACLSSHVSLSNHVFAPPPSPGQNEMASRIYLWPYGSGVLIAFFAIWDLARLASVYPDRQIYAASLFAAATAINFVLEGATITWRFFFFKSCCPCCIRGGRAADESTATEYNPGVSVDM